MSCIDKCEKCLKRCVILSCNDCETATLNFGAVEQFENGEYILHLRNMVTGIERVYPLTAVYDVLIFNLTELNGFGNDVHFYRAAISYEGEAVTIIAEDGTPYTCLDLTFEFTYDNNGNIKCQTEQVV